MVEYPKSNYGPWTTLRAFVTLLIVVGFWAVSTYLRYSR